MKKIMLLGGSSQQVIAIKTSKKLGYYTVLCDFLPDNPGQYEADKFYLVSTTDKETVLAIAMDEQVDGVLAYASDPAATTAAYVAEKMGLPSSPYESVEILCNKDKFRTFLKEHNFFTPDAKGYTNITDAEFDLKTGIFKFPVLVKPVDSSGSKGIGRIDSIVDAKCKLEHAMSFSKSKRIIVEEFVEKFGYQIAGDGLSIDGKLVFRCFGNDHFNPRCVNPFVPVSASFPYEQTELIQNKIHDEIQRLLTALHMRTTTYNFDIRIDKDINIYLMEISPRDGGNYIPDVIKLATDVDLVDCSVKAAMGEKIDINSFTGPKGYYSYFAVHSLENGILERIEFTEFAEAHIIEKHLIKNSGDEIQAFTGANKTLGCLIMRFDSFEQMIYMMDHSYEWCKVILR